MRVFRAVVADVSLHKQLHAPSSRDNTEEELGPGQLQINLQIRRQEPDSHKHQQQNETHEQHKSHDIEEEEGPRDEVEEGESVVQEQRRKDQLRQ